MKTQAKVYVMFGDSVMENFLDRATGGRQGETMLRNAVRKGLREWAVDRFEEVGKVQVHWDRKLGCGCGCSPGFRVKTDTESYVYARDYWANMNEDGTVSVRES